MSRVPEPPGETDRPAIVPAQQPAPEGTRASDADRDRVIAVLRDHYVSGGLTLEEFAERAEIALVSRTHSELDTLTTDLPESLIARTTTLERPGRVRRATHWTVAIMSGHNRRGRWRIEGSTGAFAMMGGVKLDLREAVLEPRPGTDEVEIIAISFMGGVDIVVPEGVPVVVSGFSLMGGTDDRSSGGRHTPGVPIVHVRAYTCMGGVNIRTIKPRDQARVERTQRDAERRELQRSRHDERRLAREDAREQRHELRRLGRDIGRDIRDQVHASITTGLPRRPPPSVSPWIERIVREHLGPEGLDRILNERVQQRLRNTGIDPEMIRTTVGAVASWVSGEGADLRSVAAPDGTVTILFTDIESSSAINERLGDSRWIELLREHNQLIRDQVKAHDGSEVRSLGDGFMVVFSSARRALHCAVAIQREFDVYANTHPEEPIRVRIGCHTGEAIRDADDFFGRNVVLAARIADQAKGGQILASSIVKELTESTGDITFGEPREVVLEGLSGSHTVYEVAS